jgi:hypothetical protein
VGGRNGGLGEPGGLGLGVLRDVVLAGLGELRAQEAELRQEGFEAGDEDVGLGDVQLERLAVDVDPEAGLDAEDLGVLVDLGDASGEDDRRVVAGLRVAEGGRRQGFRSAALVPATRCRGRRPRRVRGGCRSA